MSQTPERGVLGHAPGPTGAANAAVAVAGPAPARPRPSARRPDGPDR